MAAELMVAAEGVCLVFLLLILAAYIFLPRSGCLRKDGFFYSMIFTIFGVFADLVAWACELTAAAVFVQYTSNFFALVMTSFIVSAFGYYIVRMINEKQLLSMTYAHAITAVNAACVAVVVFAGVKNELFDITADDFVPGVMIYDDGGILYELPMILSLLSLVFLYALVLHHTRVLGGQKVAVLSLYFLLPMLSSILELINSDYQLTYMATGVSMSIIYMMLQSNHMNELMLREKLLNEISYVDQLTGLLNRRAYDQDLELARKEETVGIVFCDLNGLKRINDEKGHSAGDRYLISFSELITKHFPHDSVYRISGDEFVVMTCSMDPETFERSCALLRRDVDENAGMAAFGTVTGKGDKVLALVRKAEMRMYADKKDFYRHHPDYKRESGIYMDTEN